MAWVPLIVASRRGRYPRNRSAGAIVLGLLLFFVFGIIIFTFFFRSDGFTMIPLWPMITVFGGFIFFVIIIGVIASSMSAPPKKANVEPINSYQYQPQEPSHQYNPYKIQNSIQKQPEESIYGEVKQDIPNVIDINYCRFCGSKVDRDARFCHQCGTKV